MKVEIIQYQGDAAPRLRSQADSVTPEVITWKYVELEEQEIPKYDTDEQWLQKIEGLSPDGSKWLVQYILNDYPPKPVFDEATQYLVPEGDREQRVWLVKNYTQEELDKKYLASLDWVAFNKRAIMSSVWDKLESWGGSDGRVSQHFSLIRENCISIQSEPALKIRFSSLKAYLAENSMQFSQEEELELDDLLSILRTNWNWSEL